MLNFATLSEFLNKKETVAFMFKKFFLGYSQLR